MLCAGIHNGGYLKWLAVVRREGVWERFDVDVVIVF